MLQSTNGASFLNRLSVSCANKTSLLCIGLDPDPTRMPIKDVVEFNRAIVGSTQDIACAYKPNLAFYESAGSRGIAALESTIEAIRYESPDSILIGDGKRGDITSSNVYYAKALFEEWQFDATTVNSYAGLEALQPFLSYKDKGIFIWCKSSNEGAKEFQNLVGPNTKMLYEEVAAKSQLSNKYSNIGLVVGATYPDDLKKVRELCPEMPILLPGIGTQGGELSKSLIAGINQNGRNLIINSSRSIIYASDDPKLFTKAARTKAKELQQQINIILEKIGKGW